jgi:hypothetical protein
MADDSAKIKRLLKRMLGNLKYPSSHRDESLPEPIINSTTNENPVVCIIAGTINSCRKSLASSILHRRHSTSLDSSCGGPRLPLELLEMVASYLGQYDLVSFSRAFRDAYTTAERFLYRRPFTRRYDRLLRTLENNPYKGNFILELALGFETEFHSVK